MRKYYDVLEKDLWREVAKEILYSDEKMYEEYKSQLDQEEIKDLEKDEIIEEIIEDRYTLILIIEDEDFDDYFDFGEEDY